MRVLYLPSSSLGKGPVDRRRFLAFSKASKKIHVIFDPKETFDLVFCSGSGDINLAIKLKKEGFPLIFDYANHYLVEASLTKNLLRQAYFFASKKHHFSFINYSKLLRSILILADTVICSSKEQESFIKSELKIRRSIVLTDFFETDFPALFTGNFESKSRFSNRILWEGQPENLQNFLAINDKRLFKQKFSIITDETYKSFGMKRSSISYCNNIFHNFDLIKWTKENLLLEAISCDVGIIPINMDIPIYAAKPENKAILMFLLGLPVIASPTLAYKNLFKQAEVTELLITKQIDWMERIENIRIMKNSFRNDLSAHLRMFAIKNYSTSVLCKSWDLLLEEITDESTLPS
jgi:hypothetical protein